MKKQKILIVTLAVIIFLIGASYSFAAEGKRLTQGQFAAQLLKNMKLDEYLPLAVLEEDAITLLDSLGISPLTGWDKNAYLNQDDYTVILAKAAGKEKVVFTKATEVCQRTIQIISNRWYVKYKDTGQFGRLEDFLNNKSYFPAKPQCPYGLPYEDEDQDHQVDTHYHPFISSFISP